MKRILLTGSTGYLGSYIAKELQKRSCFFRAIARNPEKLKQNEIEANEVIKAELTDPDSIRECCKGIDVVISTVGITRQKDGLAYMDVDYCIVRPNGFFSDMSEFFNMAKKGRVYLFGNGELRTNPIHGEDLAIVCVDAIDKPAKEVE